MGLFESLKIFGFIFLIQVLIQVQARADIGQLYGYGSTSAGLAGANRAKSYDAFTIQRNPGLMSFSKGHRFTAGFLGAVDMFADINNVVVDGPYYGGPATNETGNVDTDVPDTFNLLVGSVFDLGGSRDWRLGLTLSLPADKVMEATTKDTYQPQYSMYMSDTQKMTLSSAASAKITDNLSLGLGVNYFLLAGATIVGRLPTTGTPEKTSSQNMKMYVKPSVALVAGFAWQPTDSQTVTLNYAGARDSRMATRLENKIEAMIAAPVIVIDTTSSIFYDPEVYSLGYAVQLGSSDLLLGVDYERWSLFEGSVMKLDVKQGFSWVQYPYEAKHRDVVVPRIGYVLPFGGRNAWLVGYAYKPSPTPSLEKETNFLDSDRHIVATGFQVPSTLFSLLDKEVNLNLHVQAHYLVPKTVTKNDPTDIGGPGYEVKGWVLSYGLNMSTSL